MPRGVGDLLGLEFPEFPSDAPKKIRFLGEDWPAISDTVTLEHPPFDDDLAWEAEVDFVLNDRASRLRRFSQPVVGYLQRRLWLFRGRTGGSGRRPSAS